MPGYIEHRGVIDYYPPRLFLSCSSLTECLFLKLKRCMQGHLLPAVPLRLQMRLNMNLGEHLNVIPKFLEIEMCN